MEREVKFSLVFRDMWQSAGKYVPRVDHSWLRLPRLLLKWAVSPVWKQMVVVLNR